MGIKSAWERAVPAHEKNALVVALCDWIEANKTRLAAHGNARQVDGWLDKAKSVRDFIIRTNRVTEGQEKMLRSICQAAEKLLGSDTKVAQPPTFAELARLIASVPADSSWGTSPDFNPDTLAEMQQRLKHFGY